MISIRSLVVLLATLLVSMSCLATPNTATASILLPNEPHDSRSGGGSVDLFSGDANSDEISRIRRLLFAGVQPSLAPTMCFMGGGVASGKSNPVRPQLTNLGMIPSNHAYIAADEIMYLLDAWNPDDMCSSAHLHLRATNLASMFLYEAMNRSFNVVYEGSMRQQDKVSVFITEARRHHYRLTMVGVTAPLAEAAMRAVSRNSSRWVTLGNFVSGHAGYARAFLGYVRRMDEALLINTHSPTTTPHMQLVLNNSLVLNNTMLGQFLSDIAAQEEELISALPDDALDKFRQMCRCMGAGEADVLCSGGDSGGGGHSEHHAMVAWRTVSIVFISTTAVFGALLIAMLVKETNLFRSRRIEAAEGDV